MATVNAERKIVSAEIISRWYADAEKVKRTDKDGISYTDLTMLEKLFHRYGTQHVIYDDETEEDKKVTFKIKKADFDNDGNAKEYNLLIKNFAFRLLKALNADPHKNAEKLNTADKTAEFYAARKSAVESLKRIYAHLCRCSGWSAKYGNGKALPADNKDFWAIYMQCVTRKVENEKSRNEIKSPAQIAAIVEDTLYNRINKTFSATISAPKTLETFIQTETETETAKKQSQGVKTAPKKDAETETKTAENAA